MLSPAFLCQRVRLWTQGDSLCVELCPGSRLQQVFQRAPRQADALHSRGSGQSLSECDSWMPLRGVRPQETVSWLIVLSCSSTGGSVFGRRGCHLGRIPDKEGQMRRGCGAGVLLQAACEKLRVGRCGRCSKHAFPSDSWLEASCQGAWSGLAPGQDDGFGGPLVLCCAVRSLPHLQMPTIHDKGWYGRLWWSAWLSIWMGCNDHASIPGKVTKNVKPWIRNKVRQYALMLDVAGGM